MYVATLKRTLLTCLYFIARIQEHKASNHTCLDYMIL
jgi:hypothetical protein